MKNESKNAKALHKGRKFMYDRQTDMHRAYVDKKTGKFFSTLTEVRTCPVCGSSKSVPIFNKSGGTYAKCTNCTMVFLNPVFKDRALDKHYRKLDSGQAAIVQGESAFYREIYLKGLNAVSRFVKKGKIFDLGCSSGIFLDIAKSKEWKTYGLEVGEAEAALCREKGHVLYTKKLQDEKITEKFDAISLWDVFEHLPHGKDELKLLKSMLNPGGVIFLQIPNSGSLAARMMRDKCRMFDGIEHVNLYNPKTIQLIAQKVGLNIKSLETVISEIAVMNNYLQYEDPYFGDSGHGDTVLNIVTAESIHKNLLGYKMQVVFGKGKTEK